MRVLHTADCHFKRQTWKSRPDIGGDAYLSLKQIVDRCHTDSQVRLVVLAGDIFDSPTPSDREVWEFLELLRQVPAHVYVAVIAGNHDRAGIRGGWPMVAPMPNVVSLEAACARGDTWQFGPLRIFGWDFVHRANLPAKLAAIPTAANLVVAHLMLKEATNGLIPSDCAAAELPTGTGPRLYLLGDYHHSCQIPVNHQTVAHYPGSTYMCTLDEPPEKSYGVLEVAQDGAMQYLTEPLRTRLYFRLQVTSPSGFEEVKSRTGAEIKKLAATGGAVLPIVHVHYTPMADVHKQLCELFPRDWCHLILTAHPLETVNPTLSAPMPVDSPLEDIVKAAMVDAFDQRLAARTVELVGAMPGAVPEIIDTWEIQAGLRPAAVGA